MADEQGIILLGQNLFFQGRVAAVAEPLGRPVRQTHTAADFWASYGPTTALVLVDLEGDAVVWAAVLAELQQRIRRGEASAARIVAFGPHEDTAAMTRAAALGAGQTLSKGRFSAALGEIIGGQEG